MFESQTFDEEWGGDIWSLKKVTSAETSTVTIVDYLQSDETAYVAAVVLILLSSGFLIYLAEEGKYIRNTISDGFKRFSLRKTDTLRLHIRDHPFG